MCTPSNGPSDAAPRHANLTSPREVRSVLAAHGLAPRRKLGQNYLVDRNILHAILDAAELRPDDHVLEVGPGLGALTEGLLERAGRVTAVELDEGLHGLLARRFADEPRLRLLCGDALDLDYGSLFASGVSKLVSNLPYCVGTRVVVEAALAAHPAPMMVVLVQREVARRFAAAEGSAERGALSVWLQQRYRVELLRAVRPGCFWPKPDVTSAVVRLLREEPFALDADEHRRLIDLTRRAFGQRRKQLAPLLSRGLAPEQGGLESVLSLFERCGVQPAARAGDLSLAQWCDLARGWPGKRND